MSSTSRQGLDCINISYIQKDTARALLDWLQVVTLGRARDICKSLKVLSAATAPSARLGHLRLF
eukprot:6189249-Pleurochrysis_carterae.AAC.1